MADRLEVAVMSKSTIRNLFVGSLVALAGGLVLLAVAGALAYANGSFIMRGPDVVGIRETPLGWAMLGLAIVAIVVLVAAAITQFVAWVGAVVNTSRLEDKTWFIVLLVTGLLSFGFIAMVIYLIAGPDDAPLTSPRPPAVDAPKQELVSRSV
jgi:hypothetical protein